MTDGKGRRGGAIFAGSLIKDSGQMIGNRFLAEAQFLGNLIITFPFSDKP